MKESKEKNILLDDESIIELYWSRNEKAISETDKKYGKYLYSIAYNIVHDELDSEECVSDTYIGTWNAIPPSRPNVFHMFLAKITRNISINKFKRNTAYKRIPSELIVSLDELDNCFPATPTLEEELEAEKLGNLISSYLEGLSHKEQLLFVCRYYYADKIGELNTVKIKNLNASTSYVYTIVAEYDALDGKGYSTHLLYQKEIPRDRS